jgi:signal transduction histidine kinase
MAQEELLRRSNDVIQELAGKLISAQEEERKRIARDLHDDFAQRLALLCIKMQTSQKKLPAGSELAQELTEMWAEANQTAENIRQISHHLHHSALLIGLPRAASGYCREFSHQRGIQVEFTHKGLVGLLPEAVSLAMFRVLQEALNNSARHSGATQVEVYLLAEGDEVKLQVNDRGKGFDPFRTHDGLGLVSMRERLRLVGGTMRISSVLGRGTKLEAVVPMPLSQIRAQISA